MPDINAYDYEAPNGTDVTYRARAVHEFPSGDESFSDWVEATPTSWSSTDTWLKHPSRPSLNVTVDLASYAGGTIARAGRRSKAQPLGSTDAVVITDTRESDSGTVSIIAQSDDERDDLAAMFDTLAPLLLQVRPTDHEPDRYLALGDHSTARGIDKSFGVGTYENLPWDEVPRPSGPLADGEL
jgi:hypothetical protein